MLIVYFGHLKHLNINLLLLVKAFHRNLSTRIFEFFIIVTSEHDYPHLLINTVHHNVVCPFGAD